MPTNTYILDQPATYRIRIYGDLDSKWSRRLGDMRITHPASALNQTVLTGELTDQAELFGILNSLYTLGLFLLFVEHLDAQAAADDLCCK